MVLLLLWSFVSFLAADHGDIHERIQKLSNQIKHSPDSTELYVTRGELYLLHGDKKEAGDDFRFCLKKKMNTDRVFLGLSKFFFAENMPDSSLFYVECALAQNGINPACLEWKGSVLKKIDAFCSSADVYEYLISITNDPSPALYIEASESWLLCDKDFAEEKTISILQAGLDRLGPLHVLENKLVDVYLHLNRTSEAIQLQTEIIDQSTLKAIPYYQRAKTLISIGDYTGAKDDLTAAIHALDQLSNYKKNTRAMRKIRNDIESLLKEITN